MKRTWIVFLLLACGFFCAHCSSDGAPRCSFAGQTTLPALSEAAWPKFARDTMNTGRIEGVGLDPHAIVRWVFPPLDREALQPISNSALLGVDGNVRLVGVIAQGADKEVKLYVLDARTGSVLNKVTPTPAPTPEAGSGAEAPTVTSGTTVTGSPLLGADSTLFIPITDGSLRRVKEPDASERMIYTLGGFVSASPNIADDGTVYLGSLGGTFAAVCPNGIARFVLAVGATQSSAAVIEGTRATDRLIVFAGDDAQVRAVDYLGRQKWVFFTSAAIRASVVVDNRGDRSGADGGRVYVADAAGWVFARTLADGAHVWSSRAGAGRPISATPALGADGLYVADEGGNLSFLDFADGAVRWQCGVGAPIRSSPAVAASATGDAVVFGADDGVVYAVDAEAAERCQPSDLCACRDVALWAVDVGAPVGRASAAIAFDGAVYIGTEGGRVFAIGAPASEPVPSSTATPTATPRSL